MSIPTEPSAALRGCLEACDRCESVLDAITAEGYTHALSGEQPVGSHLRHALEHFQCFVEGLDRGLVDYDARERNEAAERDPEQCRALLRKVRARIAAIRPDQLDWPLVVNQIAALGAEPSALNSTVQRELVFLSSHAIHHLAVIVPLCRSAGIELPQDISLAFSTAAHRQATAR